MSTIAQAVIAFKGGDPAELIKAAREQATKAGQEGGTTFAHSFTDGAKRAGFAALSGALGLATAGLLQVDSAMAKYRAETNATGADAAKAQAAILAANRSQKQGIDELAMGLAAMRTEMGLSQDEANALLVPMAKFAEVSGQTIPDAVKGMDDILDAYNLKAGDAIKVQDALVVAHQQGAGAIAEIQGNLARMAPALTAANLQWQDGAALLIAFGAAGIPAEKAPLALQHALAKVHSPEELKALMADISATTDDFARTTKAADLFGSKAGAQMAQLLRPGAQSLADFRGQVEQSGGAVDKFADNLHDDLVYKVQQGLKDAAGAMVQFAAPAGPILSGLGSLVMGVKAIGLDTALGSLWTKVATSPAVAGAAAFAGSLAGSAYGAAVAAGEWVTQSVLGLWGKVRGNPAVLASAGEAGAESGAAFGAAAGASDAAVASASAAGSKLGGSMARGFALGLLGLGVLDLIVSAENDFMDKADAAAAAKSAAQTATRVADRKEYVSELAGITTDELTKTAASLQEQLASLGADAQFDPVMKPVFRDMSAKLNDVEAELKRRAATVSSEVASIATDGATAIITATTDTDEAALSGWKDILEGMKAPWSDWRAATSAAIAGGGAELHAFVKMAASDVATLPPIFQRGGADTLKAMADGIASARSKPLDAFDALVKALKTPLTETAETARLAGELASKDLAKGLASGDPELRAQARAVKAAILDRLAELAPESGTLSKKAIAELTTALKSKDPDIRAAAQHILSTVTTETGKLPAKLHDHGLAATTDMGGGLSAGITTHVTPAVNAGVAKVGELAIPGATTQRWGYNIGSSWGAGVASGIAAHTEDVNAAAVVVTRSIHGESPPKTGPLHEIDKWGKATGLAWVGPFIAALETAADGSKLTLAKVKSEFTKAVAAYSGVGSQFGSVTPDAQVADLNRYIASLSKSLETETDPGARLETYRKIAEYQDRIAALQGKTATEEQKSAQTLIGYINVLDKALLTETDPKRRAAMQAEIETYITRINGLLAAKPEPIAPPDAATVQENALKLQQLDLEHQRALLAATPELEKANKAQLATIDAQLAQIANQLDEINYQRQYNALLLEQVNLQRQAAGLAPLDTLPAGTGAPAGPVAPPNLSDPRIGPDGTSAGYYTQDSPGVWTWHSGTPPPSAPDYGTDDSGNTLNPGAVNLSDPRDPGHAGMYLNDGSVNPNSGYAPAGPRDPQYGTTINVYNPAPEPASTSVRTRLQRTAAGI